MFYKKDTESHFRFKGLKGRSYRSVFTDSLNSPLILRADRKTRAAIVDFILLKVDKFLKLVIAEAV